MHSMEADGLKEQIRRSSQYRRSIAKATEENRLTETGQSKTTWRLMSCSHCCWSPAVPLCAFWNAGYKVMVGIKLTCSFFDLSSTRHFHPHLFHSRVFPHQTVVYENPRRWSVSENQPSWHQQPSRSVLKCDVSVMCLYLHEYMHYIADITYGLL